MAVMAAKAVMAVMAVMAAKAVIAGPTRNPWIPGQARDDKRIPGAATPDSSRGQHASFLRKFCHDL